ncbi:MAG: TnpV protein [Ruminococcus sp.]|nr:TnpV protein [Ruminococcus sp.]
MNITYTMQGDYHLPDLALPEQDNRPIGVWGQRHKNYLLHHHKIRYYNLLTSCKLAEYLANINEQAEELYESIVNQLTQQEGVTEHLKVNNPMLWVQRMNNIRNRATKMVNAQIILS